MELCTRKRSLELLLEKKPELEDDIKEMLENKPTEFGILATQCYICDGHNYNCTEYKNNQEAKKQEKVTP